MIFGVVRDGYGRFRLTEELCCRRVHFSLIAYLV